MKYLILPSLLLLVVGCSKKDDAKSSCCTGPGPQIISPHPNLDFRVPNVITPNGDGYNDFFFPVARDMSSPTPYATAVFTTQTLKVYPQTGSAPVFSSTSRQNRFDGHNDSGAELPEGTYRYELQLDDNSITGNLCIVRTMKACNCIPLDLNDRFLENCP